MLVKRILADKWIRVLLQRGFAGASYWMVSATDASPRG
jgi:hypothetical protein